MMDQCSATDVFDSGKTKGWTVVTSNGSQTPCEWQWGPAGWRTTRGPRHDVADAEAEGTWLCIRITAPEALSPEASSVDASLHQLRKDNWDRLVRAWMTYANRETTLNALIEKVQPNETTRREWQDAANSLSEPRWNQQVEAWTKTHGTLPTHTEAPVPTEFCVLMPADIICNEPAHWILKCAGPDHIDLYNCYEGVDNAPEVMRFPHHWALVRAGVDTSTGK